jgi:peroxiredoxin
LQAYQDILPEVKTLGASMAAISPQTPEYSLSMAAKHNLGFEVLSDLGNKVARQYGLVFSLAEPLRDLYIKRLGIDLREYNADAAYELPMPGTFIISQDGIIRYTFVDPDYTLRLEPGEILRVLGKIALSP